ncbi:MAG TPA: Rne/Rng family ribonuclease [Polyangiaceae bacterium]|nr:Rne/Rng family ribonuclease [Polyangiaceae bacterium]
MPKNTLVINCDIRETRVALIEGGVIAELQIERAAARGTVGNIVLGKVTRVLPGMQAAFIDVGQERAAFLHVEDLIRPDDFEAYLSGGHRHEDGESFKGDGGRRFGQAKPAAAASDDDEEDDDDEEPSAVAAAAPSEIASPAPDADDDDEEDDDEEDDDEEDSSPESDDDDEEDDDSSPDSDDSDEDSDPSNPSNPSGPENEPDAASDDDDDDEEDDDEEDDDEEDDDEEEEEQEEPDDEREASPREEAVARVDEAGEGGTRPAGGESDANRKRRRRRRKRGSDRGDSPAPAAARPQPAQQARSGGGDRGRSGGGDRGRSGGGGGDRPRGGSSRSDRDRGRGNDRGRSGGGGGPKQASRVARSVPITEVVKEGDEVIVQISKEPIGTKGARVTSHVSLPGRYAVYLPTVEHVGVSKRIGSARERARLREVVDQMKPPKGGLIVRTVAEGLTKKSLKADIGYLVKVWEEVSRKKEEGGKAPTMLYAELDLVLKTARDLFTDEIENIVIDDKEQYSRLVRFVEMFMPERVKDIELYAGDEPIFDAYGIEDEIARALSRKVPLPSGGYLIIDQAEALTAIDVNTGRYVGKGSQNLEETALKTNLEAVEEIAYQLRFRNIGGLVILDLIDMDIGSNREKVWRQLEQLLTKDKAKTTINRISELGLIEMTRKRTRESLTRTMHETCFYCDGTGQIQSRTTIAYEILRQLRRERHTLPGYSVIVNAHPAVIDVMQGEEKPAVVEAEKRYMRRIEFNPRREYHIEQFDLQGK